ncbi:Zn-finger [Streptococcus pneumoniae]|nr:Zn-finger [Streptococcus pneumoniae]
MLLASEGKKTGITIVEKPIVRTKFKRLQETGMEAENYFILHFDKEEKFQGGQLTDARLYGDGYDFQVDAKEFEKVKEFQSDFILSLVTNLDDIPKLVLIDNPLKHFEFKKNIIKNEIIEYRSVEDLY